MKTYHIVWASYDWRSSLRAIAISAAFGMVVFAAIGLLRRSFDVVDWLGFGLTYVLFSYLFPIKPPSYDLEIDDGEIRLVRDGEVKRTLRRGRVRYVREWNDGKSLVISEHGPVWTRLLWGGIGIPKSSSDYEEIKERVLCWL
jgi:hypothetical protein